MSKKNHKKTYRNIKKGKDIDGKMFNRLRHDYIEPYYMNGVFDDSGQVMRPMTQEEKDWLNTFYKETIGTNFLHSTGLKELQKRKKAIIEDETVKGLKSEMKRLKELGHDQKRVSEIKEIIYFTKKQNEEIHTDVLRDIERQMQEERDRVLLYPDRDDHRSFYNENNRRNNCLYNIMKAQGKLDGFSPENVDEIDWQVFQRILEMNDYEDILIEEVERDDREREEDRQEKVWLEESGKSVKGSNNKGN